MSLSETAEMFEVNLRPNAGEYLPFTNQPHCKCYLARTYWQLIWLKTKYIQISQFNTTRQKYTIPKLLNANKLFL